MYIIQSLSNEISKNYDVANAEFVSLDSQSNLSIPKERLCNEHRSVSKYETHNLIQAGRPKAGAWRCVLPVLQTFRNE
jgi:hypothetical protein